MGFDKGLFVKVMVCLSVISVTVIVTVVIVYNTDDGPDEEPSTTSQTTTQPTTPTTPTIPTTESTTTTKSLPTFEAFTSTTCGDVVGRKVMGKTPSGEAHDVYEFINIPYAVPPVGDRRFKPSTPLDEDKSKCWTGNLFANGTERKRCSQLRVDLATGRPTGQYTDEDCLMLHVRSPDLKGNRPVVVWLHGGFLLHGYAEARGYSLDANFSLAVDAVVVSVNYRLSALGFLSLRDLWSETDPQSYGNYGFFDQIVALHWIQNNIARFGGNPNAVTLLGQSSGATSVMAMLSSPLANGLFHRAIAFSPLPLWKKGKEEASVINTQLFSPLLQCGNKSLGQCVREAPAASLIDISARYLVLTRDFSRLPTSSESFSLNQAITDGVVVPKSPSELSCANFAVKNKIPILLSNMAQEVDGQRLENFLANEYDKMYQQVTSRLQGFNLSMSELFAMYPNTTSANVSVHPQEIWETMVTDIRVTCPTNLLAKQMSESQQHTIYRLFIEHAPSSGLAGQMEYAHHEWEIQAMLDFQKKTQFGWQPTAHDLILRDELRRICKEMIHSGSVSGGWKKYPENHAVIANEAPFMSIVNTTSPRTEQCQYFDQNGFQRFAWHN